MSIQDARRRLRSIFLYISLITVLFTMPGALPASAQDEGPQQPQPSDIRKVEQEYLMDGSAANSGPSTTPGAPTGSDKFGYNYSQIGASWESGVIPSGTNTGLTGSGGITAAINLPFAFPFYENTYNQVYISANGFLTFTQPGAGENDDQSPLLDMKAPNNVIAPFWGPITLADSPPADLSNQVMYRTLGTGDDTRFVVQWNHITQYGADFTFQAVLEQDGDIRLQYATMRYPVSGGYYCTTSGIENARGDDALVYDRFCTRSASNQAVLFERPADSHRVEVNPAKTGQFAAPGQPVEYDVTVWNTGTIGEDTFEISAVSTLWPVELLNATTMDPLSDTNGVPGPDTGPVAASQFFVVKVRVQVPADAVEHDASVITFTATSTQDGTKNDISSATLAVPDPFVLGYAPLDSGMGRLDFVEPGRVLTANVGDRDGFNHAVTETPSGNIFYVWNVSRCIDASSPCTREVWEVEYAVYNREGVQVKPPAKLANLGSPTYSTYDRDPAVFAAPNGVVGIAWVRSDPSEQGRFVEDVYVQRLTEAGAPIGGPVNVTHNPDAGFLSFYDTAITAAGTSRLALAWTTEIDGNLTSIAGAVVDTAAGTVPVPPHLLTDGVEEGPWFMNPRLAQLQNGNVFLTYHRWDQPNSESKTYSFGYEELNQNLTQVFGPYSVSTSSDAYPDVVQLGGGRVLLAWQDGSIHYEMLERDASGYTATQQDPFALPMMSMDADMNVSVAGGNAGSGVLSWSNSTGVEQHVLYYAAVNENGEVLAGPMIYKTSVNGVSTSNSGSSITGHRFAPSTAQVDLRLGGGTAITLAPTVKTASVQVSISNLGLDTAHGMTLTATWPETNPPVVVTGSSPAATCSASTRICTWNLADLTSMATRNVSLTLRVEPLPYGESYPIQFAVKANETPDPSDTRVVAVYPALRLVVPYVTK